jgi:hypothetical protein
MPFSNRLYSARWTEIGLLAASSHKCFRNAIDRVTSLWILKHLADRICATASSPDTSFIPEGSLIRLINRLVANPSGAFGVLAIAAFLEAWGDSFFQSGIYRASGFGRVGAILAGTLVLAMYGSVVNIPRWDFGRLIGVYVVLFFLLAQMIAAARFGQSPTPAIYAGGALITSGGLVIAFWR